MSDTPVNPFDDAEEIAKKSMVLFFLIDCSGSMGGSKIGTVNSVMEELIPEIRGIGGADADIKLAVLKFSGGCTTSLYPSTSSSGSHSTPRTSPTSAALSLSLPRSSPETSS